MASGNGRPPARAGFAASSSVVAEHVDALVSSVGLFMADGNRSAVAIFSSLPTVAIAATCGTHIHTHSVASAFYAVRHWAQIERRRERAARDDGMMAQ